MKKIILILFVLIGLASGTHAQGTLAGTSILFQSATVNYNSFSEVLNNSASVTVDAIHGIRITPLTEILNQATVSTFNFARSIENAGNITSAVTIQDQLNGSGWTRQYVLDDNGDGIWQSNENTVLTPPFNLAPSQNFKIFLTLVPPASPVSFSAQMRLTADVTSDGPVYLGFNGISYGGLDQIVATALANLTVDFMPPQIQNFVPANFENSLAVTRSIHFDLIETSLNPTPTITLILNDVDISAWLNLTATANGLHVVYDPSPDFSHVTQYRVTVNATDNLGNRMPTYNSVFFTGADDSWPAVVSLNPGISATRVPTGSSIFVALVDLNPGVNTASVRMWVKGVEVTGFLDFSGSTVNTANVLYDPPVHFASFEYVPVQIVASDLSGLRMPTLNYAFTTSPNGTEGKLHLTVYLEGYYNSGTQIPTTVDIQLRATRNIPVGPIYTVTLNGQGQSSRLSVSPGNFYVVVQQHLPGLIQRINHAAVVTDLPYNFTAANTVTLNLSVTTNVHYAPYYQPAGYDSPMKSQGNVLVLKGGNADGNQHINITDIVKWNNAASDPNGDQRGKSAFSDESNFDGNHFINTDDFTIWNRNRGQSIPLPEEE